MVIPLETGGLVTALQGLDVKPELIEQVVHNLTKTGTELDGALVNAQMAPTEFGHRASASSLGLHYNKAFEVMQATIDGIAADIVAFGTTAKAAAAYVDEADTASAADLTKARAAVEDLGLLAKNSHADHNYDQARNGRTPASTPSSTDGDA